MKTIFKALALATPVMFMAACGGDDDNLDDRLDIADPKVRVVHAVPLGPDVELLRNGTAVANTTVSYKEATPYFDVDSGNATWVVRTTGSPALDIGQQEFNASRGNKFTLMAVPAANSLTEVLFISDPYNKSLTSDKARVRVVNASFNASNIDAYITRAGANLAGLTPTFPSVAYKAAVPATGNDSLEFDTADSAYVLTVTAAGSKTPVYQANVSLTKNADWLVTLLPNGVAANDLKVLVVQSDDTAPAQEVPNAL